MDSPYSAVYQVIKDGYNITRGLVESKDGSNSSCVTDSRCEDGMVAEATAGVEYGH